MVYCCYFIFINKSYFFLRKKLRVNAHAGACVQKASLSEENYNEGLHFRCRLALLGVLSFYFLNYTYIYASVLYK